MLIKPLTQISFLLCMPKWKNYQYHERLICYLIFLLFQMRTDQFSSSLQESQLVSCRSTLYKNFTNLLLGVLGYPQVFDSALLHVYHQVGIFYEPNSIIGECLLHFYAYLQGFMWRQISNAEIDSQCLVENEIQVLL